MFKSFRFLLFFCCVLGLQTLAGAQNETAALKKLTRGSDVIVTGKVTGRKSGWNEDKTRIYTRTTLQVNEVLKGKGTGGSVEIITPGGEVDGVGELYTHMPVFENNEEVLVFLKKDDKNRAYRVLDGEDGKLIIRNEPNTNEKISAKDPGISEIKAQIRKLVNEK
jgi:hypothetical protein